MGRDRRQLKVLIADDHPMFRLGLRLALKSLGFCSIDEAVDGQHAVELCRGRQYDVVILDLRMPRMDGVAATARITRDADGRGLKVPVVVLLSSFDEPAVVHAAAQAGAVAYLGKETDPAALAEAIDRLLANPGASLIPDQGVPNLAPRESEVLGLIVDGMSVKEVAVRLGISPETVKDHVARVYAKIGVNDRVGLVREAQRLGWTSLMRPDGTR